MCLECIVVCDGEMVLLEVCSICYGLVISDIYELVWLLQVQCDWLVIVFVWIGFDCYDKIFLSLLVINWVEGWEQFFDVVVDFGVLLQNMVYVDVEGNIGYVFVGCVLFCGVDDDFYGLVFLFGWESCYDWVGYVLESVKLCSFNFCEGFIVMVNQCIVLFDNVFDFGYDWVLFYCYECICEWFGGFGQCILEDSLELQNDEFFSVMVSLLLKMLEQVSDFELCVSEVFVLFQGWNYQVVVDLVVLLIVGYWVCVFICELL